MKRLTSSIYQRDSSALLIYQNYKFRSFFRLISLSVAGLVTLSQARAAVFLFSTAKGLYSAFRGSSTSWLPGNE
jgi:hypothetical protein